jgi:hypothetical protein
MLAQLWLKETYEMKRRNFGILAGSSVAAAAAGLPAKAESATPDASLLKTTLTPLGSERAGNADGSIPPWTGGVTAPALPVTTPVDVPMFQDEQPLYTVDASNLAQYNDLISPGTAAMITKFGFGLKVYQSHRTHAVPQYVYDNIAANVGRAKLDPAGGQLGFTGGYGGVPFPIIDTSDPLVGGAQLIWNHELAWPGYSNWTLFSPGLVVTNGQLVLTLGGMSRFIYPYYDPNGSVDSYEGYFYKLHEYESAPASNEGSEAMVWYSSNTRLKPDITWAVLPGEGRVRQVPNESYDTPSPNINGIANYDEGSCFSGSPDQYDWSYIGKQEMLIPYNNNGLHFHSAQELMQPGHPNVDLIRWEKHRVWILEANLRSDKRNVLKKRRFYLDEDTYSAILGQSYDADGNMVRTYIQFNRCVPSMPGTITQGIFFFSVQTGDYAYVGTMNYKPYVGNEYIGPQPPNDFDPQQMAASASF